MTPCTGRALGGASQGDQIDYREAALGAPEQKFALPYIGGVYAGGMVWGGGDVCPEESEYGRAVHCNATDSGTLQGDFAEARDVGH